MRELYPTHIHYTHIDFFVLSLLGISSLPCTFLPEGRQRARRKKKKSVRIYFEKHVHFSKKRANELL